MLIDRGGHTPDEILLAQGVKSPERRRFLDSASKAFLIALTAETAVNQLPVHHWVFEQLVQNTLESLKPKVQRGISFGAYGPTPQLANILDRDIQRRHDFMVGYGDAKYLKRKQAFVELVGKSGKIPVISWKPRDPGSKKMTYHATNEAYHEVHGPALTKFLNILNQPYPVVLNFYEPNTGSDPEPPEQYASFIRYVSTLINQLGLPNICLGFYPSAQYPLTFFTLDQYYPGDEYLDELGFSLYDTYTEDFLHPSHYFPGNLSPLERSLFVYYKLHQASNGNKPISFAELGIGRENDEDAADWFGQCLQMATFLNMNVDIFNVNFAGRHTGNLWDMGKDLIAARGDTSKVKIDLNERNWRMDTTIQRVNAFKKARQQNGDSFDASVTFLNIVELFVSQIGRDSLHAGIDRDAIIKIDNLNLEKIRESESRSSKPPVEAFTTSDDSDDDAFSTELKPSTLMNFPQLVQAFPAYIQLFEFAKSQLDITEL